MQVLTFKCVIYKNGERGEDAHVINSGLPGVGTLWDSIRSLSFPCSWFPLSFDKLPPIWVPSLSHLVDSKALSVYSSVFSLGFPPGSNLLPSLFSCFLFTTIPLTLGALCTPDLYSNMLSSPYSIQHIPDTHSQEELSVACLTQTVAYLSDFFGGRIHLS